MHVWTCAIESVHAGRITTAQCPLHNEDWYHFLDAKWYLNEEVHNMTCLVGYFLKSLTRDLLWSHDCGREKTLNILDLWCHWRPLPIKKKALRREDIHKWPLKMESENNIFEKYNPLCYLCLTLFLQNTTLNVWDRISSLNSFVASLIMKGSNMQ